MKRLLILGGTGEAAELAQQAEQLPLSIISSLAGRTQHPYELPGLVRIGGFGGAVGLANYLQAEQIDLLVDATHPFAIQISSHAVTAAIATQTPLLRITRPRWQPAAGDRWIEVDSLTAAADYLSSRLSSIDQRIFLTIGRQELAAFAQVSNCWFLMRMIDPPTADVVLPPGEILLARGPFSLDAERSLLTQYQIDAIVSKNSGGTATYAKIIAARELQKPVVMVGRSQFNGGEEVSDVATAINWLRSRL
jgi:precorrin-6A/cobalt-precorrin-6A reductase